jgi:hypothetical protein
LQHAVDTHTHTHTPCPPIRIFSKSKLIIKIDNKNEMKPRKIKKKRREKNSIIELGPYIPGQDIRNTPHTSSSHPFPLNIRCNPVGENIRTLVS